MRLLFTKKAVFILTLIFLFGFLAGCSVSLSPGLYSSLYTAPHYVGPDFPINVYSVPVITRPIIVPHYHSYYRYYSYSHYHYHPHPRYHHHRR